MLKRIKMKQLYILLICLCVSLNLIANQLNEGVDSVKSEKCTVNKDISAGVDKELPSVMSRLYKYAFFTSISLNVCLLFVFYKKNIKINKLRKRMEDDKWKSYSI